MKYLFVVFLLFYTAAIRAQFTVDDAAPIGIDAATCEKALLTGYPRIYEFCWHDNDEETGEAVEDESDEDDADDEDTDNTVRHSYRIDMPTDDCQLSQNVRQWMANTISIYSQCSNYYIAVFDHSPVPMMDTMCEDFYEDYLHAEHEVIVFDDEAFDFYRYFESPTYVTYRYGVTSSFISNQVRYSTFEKKTGRRLSLSDIVLPEKEHAWRMLVLKYIRTAVKERHQQHGTEYSHYFFNNITRYNNSIDSVRMNDVALWPNGMVVSFQASEIDDLAEGRYEILLPYNELDGMLLVAPMEQKARDVFVESYKKACTYSDFIDETKMKRGPVYTEQYLNELSTQQDRKKKEKRQSAANTSFHNNGIYLHALDKTAYMAYMKKQWDVAARLYDEYLNLAETSCGTADMAWWRPAPYQLECLMNCRRYDDVLTLGRKLWPAQKQLEYIFTDTDVSRMQHVTLTTMAEAAYLSNPQATDAVELLLQAMTLSKVFGCDFYDALGEKGVCHVHLTDSMNMTRYQYALGMNHEVANNVKKVAPLVRMALCEDFRYSSSYDRQNRWKKMETWYTEFLPLIALQTGDKELIADAYDAVLFGRGLLLNSDIAIRQILLEKGNDADKALINSVEVAKKELENILNADMREDDRLIKIEEIYNSIDDLEWDITNNSFNYEDFTQRLFIDFKDVKNHLGEKDIAIEFLRFPTSADSVIYAALTLRQNYSTPKLTVLFEEHQLTNTQTPNNPLGSSSLITQLVWKPLERELSNIENIYFSPVGELHKIGIEYADGMESYHLYRLTSTRLIAIEKPVRGGDKLEKSAILFGGLQYKFGSGDWADLKKQNDRSKQATFRDVPLIDTRAWRDRINYLPGSEEEVNAINKMLRSNGQPTTLLTDMEGTEEAFKQLSGKHNSILHISTHGFYDTTARLAAAASYDVFTAEAPQQVDAPQSATSREYEDLALSRSGLFMAGAADALDEKTRGNIPEGVDDGVLTAREIAQLDLRTLDLVVLSACETGLGDVSGDGVFGLQRGFKKAGAKTLLMSLWKVDDHATQLLMTEFYRNLTAGQSKRQAFIAAQQHLRQCEGGKYDKPEFWAAFILLDATE